MSEERLIIPKRPRHHQQRFILAVVVCGLVVAGVWAWQMKITFSKYAAERAVQKQQQMVEENDDGPVVEIDNNAASLKARLDEFQSLLEGVVLEELAKDETLEEVEQPLTAEVDTNSGATATDVPEVPSN